MNLSEPKPATQKTTHQRVSPNRLLSIYHTGGLSHSQGSFLETYLKSSLCAELELDTRIFSQNHSFLEHL